MSAPTTLTVKATAYYYPSFQELKKVVSGEQAPFLSTHGGVPKDGVAIGDTEVVITFRQPEEIVRGQLDSLKTQLQQERADSQMRQNAILDQISKLQALEWEGGVA